MLSVLGVLFIFIGFWPDVPQTFGGVSRLLHAHWRRRARGFLPAVGEDRDRPLYSDLFEQMSLDTSCHLFLMGTYLTETDHLRALILQLLSHGGKHREELDSVERRHRFGGLPHEWRHSSRWESPTMSDRVGWQFVGSASPISFAAFLRRIGSTVVWLTLFLNRTMSVMLDSFRGRSTVFWQRGLECEFKRSQWKY